LSCENGQPGQQHLRIWESALRVPSLAMDGAQAGLQINQRDFNIELSWVPRLNQFGGSDWVELIEEY